MNLLTRFSFLLLAAISLFALAACSPTEKTAQPQAQNTPASAEVKAPDQAAPENAQPAVRQDPAPARDEAAFAKLLDPSQFNDVAPVQFNVNIKTTKGDIVVELHRDWAPLGVDRFYNLVVGGYFNDIAIFRAVAGFVIQFGIHGSPLVNNAWYQATIQDDPVRESNVKGTLTFATGGPNTRTTQLFINLNDNKRLDKMGFSPIGKVIKGMDVIDKLNYEYSELPSMNQEKIHKQGNAYLKTQFPNLDYIISMSVE